VGWLVEQLKGLPTGNLSLFITYLESLLPTDKSFGLLATLCALEKELTVELVTAL